MRYSTCFAFVIKSATSSFLFAGGQPHVRDPKIQLEASSHSNTSGASTFSGFLFFRHGHRVADLPEVGPPADVRDARRHYRQKLKRCMVHKSHRVQRKRRTDLFYLILELGNAVHV